MVASAFAPPPILPGDEATSRIQSFYLERMKQLQRLKATRSTIHIGTTLPETHDSSFLVLALLVAAMKLSGLVFHPKASSCPRNQWQPRNGLTFLSRSCLRQISQNDPCTFQNLANYLNCCFCIEQSLIIKDRYYCSVKKNSAVTEKYQIFTLFSWIIVIVMVIIVLLRLLYTAFKGLLYSWLYSMNGEYFQFI